MQQHRRGSKVALTGDFNAFPGFERCSAIRYLKGELGGNPVVMEDTFRVARPGDYGSTFGDAGKIDYVFAGYGTPVSNAWIDRQVLERKEGWEICQILHLHWTRFID